MTDHPHPHLNSDPTMNVRQMVGEAITRLDDLREGDRQRLDDLREAESRRVDEQMKLRADFSIQLNVAEAKRIDAIRAVDVNAVSVANERATAQAAVLANQVSASAETLRSLVAATAATVAQQLAQVSTQFTDRLSSLEKASYEGQGKQALADPMMADFLIQMKAMQQSISEGKGRSGVSAPLLAMIATFAGGLIVFLIQKSFP